MTLNESIKESEWRMSLEESRVEALRALREKGFEYDPAAADFVRFLVLDVAHPKAEPVKVHGFRVTETAGWAWVGLDGDLAHGAWNELIAEITAGTLFPVQVLSARGTVTSFEPS